MNVKTIPTGAIAANCAILSADGGAPATAAKCLIFDPGADADDLISHLKEARLEPEAILLTHGHFDHIGGVPGLLAHWPQLPVLLHPLDLPMLGHPMNQWPPEYPPVERPATTADVRAWLAAHPEWGINALHTPGHTPGSVCYHLPAEQTPLLISGDTLFAGSCGRTDFPGGSPADMANSLRALAQLPPETRVLPGHGGATTIAREVASNPFLR